MCFNYYVAMYVATQIRLTHAVEMQQHVTGFWKMVPNHTHIFIAAT